MGDAIPISGAAGWTSRRRSSDIECALPLEDEEYLWYRLFYADGKRVQQQSRFEAGASSITIAWASWDGQVEYALEGSVFIAGG